MIGIGGIGMSALAQLYHSRGYTVSGSDRDLGPTAHMLQKKGITVHKGHEADYVPSDASRIVYSDAIPEDSPERVYAREQGILQLSYFQALGEISKDYFTIAVTGTHGKTTTTGLIGKALVDLGYSPTIVCGSIMTDFGSNFVAGEGEVLVVEACEYHDHLLELASDILVITNLEWDHGDWFPSLEALQKTMERAILALPEQGRLVVNTSDPGIGPLLEGRPALDYMSETVPTLSLLGSFNERNAQAAKAAIKAFAPEVDETRLNASLATFKGTWRRFEYKGKTKQGAQVYDDYAHHPTAVRETLLAVKEKFPDMKLVLAFHPHLYSRTRDFFDEFAESLSLADMTYIVPIYPARERAEDFPGVTSEQLVKAVKGISGSAEFIPDFTALEKKLSLEKENTLVLTMGAGDIYKVAESLID